MNHTNQGVVVEDVVRPFLKPLESAVRRGQWEGIDGARKCFENPRLASLDKLFNPKVQREVLVTCFLHMAEVAERAQEGAVMREFTNLNPAVVLQAAEEYPEIFQRYPSVLKYCLSALNEENQRKLRKSLQI